MVRTSVIAGFLMTCMLAAHADEPGASAARPEESSPTHALVVPGPRTPAVLPSGAFDLIPQHLPEIQTLEQDLGSSVNRPVIHLNNGGVDGTSGNPQGNSAAANRLRAVRDTPLLPGKAISAPPKRQIGTPLSSSRVPAFLDNSTKGPLILNADRATSPFGDGRAPAPKLTGSSSRRKPVGDEPHDALGTASIVVPEAVVESDTFQHGELPSILARRGLPSVDRGQINEFDGVSKTETPQLAEPELAPVGSSEGIAEDSHETSTEVPHLASLPYQKRHTTTATSTESTEIRLDEPRFDTVLPETSDRETSLSGPSAVVGRPQLSEQSETTFLSTMPRRAEFDSQLEEGSVSEELPSDATAGGGEDSERGFPSPNAMGSMDSENVLLSHRSPVIVVKTHGPQTIRVGRDASYYLSAANAGDLDAEDVEVSVAVPSWAEVTENQASSGNVRVEPSSDGNNLLKWSLRNLAAKSQERLQVNLVPRSSRPIELGVSWSFKPVSALAQIQVQEPKLQLSVVGPSDVQFGDTKLYTITAHNPGTGDAENVVLTLLPLSDGRASAGTREMGTIPAGSRRTVEVELTARQAGELAVRAHAAADGGLSAAGEQRVLVRRANLIVEVVGPDTKYADTQTTYRIKFTNNGDAIAQDVLAVASLPVAARYVSSDLGGTYDANRGKVTWPVSSLRPGAFQIVELTVTLMSEGQNRLDVRASSGDTLTADASVVTTVESLADLDLMVNDPRGAVAIGTEMTYEIVILNRGTKAARNINVVGYFSEGIEPIAVRGWQADVEVGQVVLEQIPRLAPGQEMVIKVAAKAQRPGDHVFRAELDSNDPETKLAVEEWTRFYGEATSANHVGQRRDDTVGARRQ